MANFETIQDRVSGIVIDLPTYVQDSVPDLINKAMRDIQDDHPFKVMERETAVTSTTEGTRTLMSIPTRFKKFRGMPYEVIYVDDVASGRRELMSSTERNDVLRLFDLDDEGPPQFILDATPTDDDNTRVLEVWPLPDGANSGHSDGEYRVIVPYWAYVADLAAAGDTNWFTDNADWYLTFQAAAEGFFLDWNTQDATVWVEKAADAKRRVIKADKMYRLGDCSTFVPHKNVFDHKTVNRGFVPYGYSSI